MQLQEAEHQTQEVTLVSNYKNNYCFLLKLQTLSYYSVL